VTLNRIASLSIAVAFTLAGCAAAPAGAPPGAAPAPIAAVAPAAATGTAAATDTPEHIALVKQARNFGYKAETHGSKTFYCKTEASIGTRFEKTSCVSDAQLADIVHQQIEAQDELAKGQRACAGSACASQ
jgi:hypothetical protein